MLLLEIYIGLCIIVFAIMLILFKTAPTGWQDENGFHQLEEKEELITFPLKKTTANNLPAIDSELTHYQRLKKRKSGLQITLAA